MTFVTTPGRVNLIGEWIDFNGGTVLPMALPQSVQLELHANGGQQDRIQSEQFADHIDFDISAPAASHWSGYVRGALQYARAQGWLTGGQDVSLKSTIPVGAGLSSSAATIVAALKASSGDLVCVDPVSIAHAAKAVENEFIGVPCGIMDQMAVAIGTNGNVLALDTRDCSYEIIPVPTDWTIAVVHSGIGRALADGRYKTRREECLKAADALNVSYLCEANLEAAQALPEALGKRARHVISEGHRSLRAIDALKSGDRQTFGLLMQESHTSLRDDFEVSVPEMDAMVRDAVELGADGARMTGAGFGGCFVCLIAVDRAEAWWPKLQARHPGMKRIA